MGVNIIHDADEATHHSMQQNKRDTIICTTPLLDDSYQRDAVLTAPPCLVCVRVCVALLNITVSEAIPPHASTQQCTVC
jgi:hypothetical protein